jgi:hypothetical protein
VQTIVTTRTGTETPRPALNETICDTVQVLGYKSLWQVRNYTTHRVPLAMALWLTVLLTDARATHSKNN